MQQENLSQPFPPFEQEEDIDYRRIFYLILRNWYWLPISIALGVTIAFFYVKRQHQVYKAEATIMVPKSGDSFNLQQLFDEQFRGAGAVVANELEILKSYTLNNNVVHALNWRVVWETRNYLRWDGLYGREPFTVLEEEGCNNANGIPVFIEPIDAVSYKVWASGKATIGGVPRDIGFESTGKFGEQFKNDVFCFTLLHNVDPAKVTGNQYRFAFQNMHALTRAYQSKLKVELTDRNSEVIRMEILGAEPLREVHYLNKLIDIYLDDKLKMQTQIQRQTLEFINQRLAGITDSLDAAGDVFNTFRSENQIFDLSAQGEMVMKQLSTLEEQILMKEAELEYYNSLVDYLKTGGETSTLKAPSVAGIQDAALNNLVYKLAEQQTRRQMLTLSTHEKNPTLTRLDAEIDQLKTQLNENLENLISNTGIALQSFERQKESIRQRLARLPGQEQQLIDISRRYEITGNLYDLMLQKRAEFEIALASSVVNIQVIDEARIENTVPTGMGNLMKYLLGAVVALVLVLGFIFIKDLLDNKIHMQEDVEGLTNLPVLGHVLHNTGLTELFVAENPATPFAESVRSIRTTMMFALNGSGDKVIGVNSLRPSEGKTFMCINLALILAMNNKKTLLIGADMRKPRFASVFGLPKDKGLSKLLSGQIENKEEVVFDTTVDNLFVIPGGPLPPNPAELLERDTFKELLAWAREQYDFVVIDNSPVSMVTDGFITSKLSDLNVFILRNGVSRKDQVKYINDVAAKGLMKNIALVINDIMPGRFNYYQYSSYKYAYIKGY